MAALKIHYAEVARDARPWCGARAPRQPHNLLVTLEKGDVTCGRCLRFMAAFSSEGGGA